MEKKTWALVADASKASIYAFHRALVFKDQLNENNLELLGSYFHDQSRMKTSDLVSDKLGDFGSGAFVENTSPKQHEAEVFAHQLIQVLDANRKENSFKDIILVCPAHFMGTLCKHMPHELQKMISQRIEKDYTHMKKKELFASLLNCL